MLVNTNSGTCGFGSTSALMIARNANSTPVTALRPMINKCHKRSFSLCTDLLVFSDVFGDTSRDPNDQTVFALFVFAHGELAAVAAHYVARQIEGA